MASNRMIALLGLLAVAGYQNRDKLAEMLGRVTGGAGGTTPRDPADSSAQGGGLGGLLGGAGGSGAGGLGGLLGGAGAAGGLGGLLGGLLGGAQGGGNLRGGLNDLIENMQQSGHGDAANSWVKSGPNHEVGESQLEQALGSDTIDELTRQTGLSREDLLSRLKSVLPTAVDKMTPQGRMPTESEASLWST